MGPLERASIHAWRRGDAPSAASQPSGTTPTTATATTAKERAAGGGPSGKLRHIAGRAR